MREPDFIVLSNSYSGEFNDISGLNNIVTSYLGLERVPSVRIDNTSGSGGSAILIAKALIESGKYRRVLVIGVEKMTSRQTREVTKTIASLLHERERKAGFTLPSLASFSAKEYMSKFNASRESIAMVAVKNHKNSAKNPFAHSRKEISLDEVLSSRIIADPLRLYEFSPISDGAASILLTTDEDAYSFTDKPVFIKSCVESSSESSVISRNSFIDFESVRESSRLAYKEANVTPVEVDFAEVHDMATILEVIQTEEIGFFRRGEGWKAVLEGKTEIRGEKPVNTSGGLNGKGHPIGATGIAQAVEVFHQLRGEAGERQVKSARIGLSLNMAGFGNSSVVTIYGVEP
jgi:Acetyl-CoA acetyltransferase